MPTSSFDGNTLKSVEALYARKDGKKPEPRIYRDTGQAGLIISAGKTGATWKISTNSLNRSLGDLSLYGKDDIAKLRELVALCIAEHKTGRKIEAMIEYFKVHKDLERSVAEQAVINGTGIKWPAARDAFIEWAYQNKAEATVDGYKSALGACTGSVYEKDFEVIVDKPIASITLGDLSRVKESIVRRGANGELKGTGLRQADLCVAALRSAWRYFLDKPSVYRLESNVSLGLSNVQEKKKVDENEEFSLDSRALTQLQIGAIIYGLQFEDNRIAADVLKLQALTGQRRNAAVISRRIGFKEHDHYGMVWRTKGKGDTWRVLPLGPVAGQLVQRSLIDYEKFESTYLFPKARVKKAGDATEGKTSKRQVSRVLEDMRKPGGILFKLRINPSTHTLRKAFITYFKPRMHTYSVGGKPLNKDDIQMITHWNEGREDTASSIYDLNDYLDVKHAILTAWETYVMEGYRMYTESLHPQMIAAE